MAGRGTDGIPIRLKENMYWMGGNYGVNQDAAQINNVLDRMHRNPRPRTNVVVSVMNRMGQFV